MEFIRQQRRNSKTDVVIALITLQDASDNLIHSVIILGAGHPCAASGDEVSRKTEFYEKIKPKLASKNYKLAEVSYVIMNSNDFDKYGRGVKVNGLDKPTDEFFIISTFADNYNFVGRQLKDTTVIVSDKAGTDVRVILPSERELTSDDNVDLSKLSNIGTSARKVSGGGEGSILQGKVSGKNAVAVLASMITAAAALKEGDKPKTEVVSDSSRNIKNGSDVAEDNQRTTGLNSFGDGVITL